MNTEKWERSAVKFMNRYPEDEKWAQARERAIQSMMKIKKYLLFGPTMSYEEASNKWDDMWDNPQSYTIGSIKTSAAWHRSYDIEEREKRIEEMVEAIRRGCKS